VKVPAVIIAHSLRKIAGATLPGAVKRLLLMAWVYGFHLGRASI
jgi:hypothetical protein